MTVEPLGRLIDECSLPGERRADDVFPAHPNGLQASPRTWLLLYATRGWRAVDDDRSIVYQIRRGTPDGELVKEGMLARSVDDWDATGDGTPYVRQHGHPVLFGMPEGATVDDTGASPPHAGLFVAKWRIKAAGRLDPATGTVSREHDLWERTQGVQWAQFRLNEAEDDIDIVQPVTDLRQVGYEAGLRFCAADTRSMNQTFTQAVPYSESPSTPDGSQWIDVNHFDGGRVAALRYRFDPSAGIYRWTDIGPFVAGPEPWRHSEVSIARCDDGWIIATRASTADRDGSQATGWIRTADPLSDVSDLTLASQPPTSSPRTLYRCPDGVLRLLSGDPQASPYGLARNPLYLWDIDPRTLAATDRRVIFDCVATDTLPRETYPVADMGKLLPHAGGATQWLVWRVRTRNVHHTYRDPAAGAKVASAYGFPPLREEWKGPQGIYYGRITYDRDHPGLWRL